MRARGPTNRFCSPNFSARCANPCSIDRYRCPTVAKSWGWGTMSRSDISGTASCIGASIPFGAVQLHALGPLQEDEVPERRRPERHECQVHPGGIVVRGCREVRTREVRSRSDRRQQVVHEREVEHLLGRHVRDRGPPAVDRRQLAAGQSLVLALLERERREQVLAHDPVLELGRLAQHVDQRLAMLDHKRRLRARPSRPATRASRRAAPDPRPGRAGHSPQGLPDSHWTQS